MMKDTTKLVWIFIIVVMLTLRHTADYFFTRSSITFTVLTTDAIPPSCYDYLLVRGRSNRPTVRYSVYCGHIFTDHGQFKLIQSYNLYPFADTREDMVAALKPGCTFTVRYFGFGDKPFQGQLNSNRIDKTILAIEQAGPCD